MRRIGICLLFVALSVGCGPGGGEYEPANGDIVFHTSRSSQSAAIQLVTQSRYSHMGIVYIREGRPFVYEAVEPVKITPLEQWTSRGEDGHFVAKRLRDADQVLTAEALNRMYEVGAEFEGKHYDLRFEWSDDQVYCSELVWKVYERALGLEIGNLETFADFDLSSPIVREKIEQRWGDAIPMDEPVISPAAMFSSPLLVTVHDGR